MAITGREFELEEMRLKEVSKLLNDDFIMPEAFDSRVAEVVSNAVKAHIS